MAHPDPSRSVVCASQRCRRAELSGDLSSRPSLRGFHLCGACRRGLAADLDALPGLYREGEEQAILPARRSLPVKGSAPGPEAPVNEAGVEARHEAVICLAFWARLALEGCPAGSPAPRREVPELAAFLRRHVDLLAADPAAGSAADEIAQVVGRLRRLVAPPRATLVPLGRCVEPGCDADVLLPARGGEDLVLRGPRCRAGHVLTPRQWLLLNRRTPTPGTEESP